MIKKTKGIKAASLPVLNLTDTTAFAKSDHQILERYGSVADAIALICGKGCEVVLHSLEDISHSVVKIVNGHITGRTLGSPLTDLGLKILNAPMDEAKDIIGSYFAYTESGRPIKSLTLLIRNDRRRLIGMLCVNFDLSTSLISLIKDFSPFQESAGAAEHFPAGVGDLIRQALTEESESLARIPGVSIQEKSRMIVEGLEKRGIFSLKSSVEIVAKHLGITKYTIYKYLREFRNNRE